MATRKEKLAMTGVIIYDTLTMVIPANISNMFFYKNMLGVGFWENVLCIGLGTALCLALFVLLTGSTSKIRGKMISIANRGEE